MRAAVRCPGSVSDRALAEAFVAALDPDLAATLDATELAATLSHCMRCGRAAWPGIEVDSAGFVRHLARHCRHEGDLVALAIEDLYLAHACAMREEGALRVLSKRLGTEVGRAMRRLQVDDDEADDVRLAVMHKLVVDDPPKIGSYAGKGSLDQWLAAVAAREAIGRRRTAARRRGLLDAAAEDLVPPADPELGFLKQHYRAHFKHAFAEAFAGLAPSDRTVLRHRFVDGLTLEQIAAAVGVHRATAARSLARIRGELLEETRRALHDRLGADGAEIDAVVRLIASNFEVSMQRLLGR